MIFRPRRTVAAVAFMACTCGSPLPAASASCLFASEVLHNESPHETTHVMRALMKRHTFGIAEAMRSRIAAIGTGFYLLAFVSASIYPLFDRRTFSGLTAVLLGWPWIDYLPSAWFPLTIVLNAIIIYGLLAVLSLMPTLVPRLLRGIKARI
jgi:hypothetical protein